MNLDYEIVLHWSSEDQGVVAEAPELAGCAADEKSYAEAIADTQIVIEEWIETARELGQEIPKPKGRLMFA